MTQLAMRLLVFCWGRCGGWGFREQDTGDVPCDVPGCLREHGHDQPHNPRVWESLQDASREAARRKR